jgi:SAM-dependent methyltransferase
MSVSSWTDRQRLQRQYADPTNLATRVAMYDHLVPHEDIAPRSFEEWVLDRLDWAGDEAVLDVGRGAGAYEPALRRRAGCAVGLDLSPGMLVPTDPAAPLRLVVGDAQHLPVRGGRFHVVLAAHMLYHVPDIDRALGEIRRALRPGGTALLVANGADDKREIRAWWRDAADRVAPGGFVEPAWTGRFSVDASLDAVRRVFPDARVEMLTGQFRFPTPAPVMAWVDSLRAGTEEEIGASVWDAVAAELQGRIERQIDRHGHFAVTKASGVVVARQGAETGAPAPERRTTPGPG